MEIPKNILNKLNKARALNNDVRVLTDEILEYFNSKDIDLTKFTGGCNSSNLEEMILCYINYNGEDDIYSIINRFKDIKE